MYLFVVAGVDAELLVASYHAFVHVFAAEPVKLHLIIPQLFLKLL